VSIPLRRHPLIEQAAAHLRDGFRSGRWSGKLPGVLRLADELVVSKQIVRDALALLEREGWITNEGAGSARRITGDPGGRAGRGPLRVLVLFHDPLENMLSHTAHLMFGARRKIEAAGHVCVIASTSISATGSNPTRLGKLLDAEQADAWIVVGAPKEVLEWFVARQIPVLALGGRFQNLPLACCATSIGLGIRAAMGVLSAPGTPPGWPARPSPSPRTSRPASGGSSASPRPFCAKVRDTSARRRWPAPSASPAVTGTCRSTLRPSGARLRVIRLVS